MFFNGQKLEYIRVTYSVLEKKQVVQRCSAKNLTKFTGKHLCQGLFLKKTY